MANVCSLNGLQPIDTNEYWNLKILQFGINLVYCLPDLKQNYFTEQLEVSASGKDQNLGLGKVI